MYRKAANFLWENPPKYINMFSSESTAIVKVMVYIVTAMCSRIKHCSQY